MQTLDQIMLELDNLVSEKDTSVSQENIAEEIKTMMNNSKTSPTVSALYGKPLNDVYVMLSQQTCEHSPINRDLTIYGCVIQYISNYLLVIINHIGQQTEIIIFLPETRNYLTVVTNYFPQFCQPVEHPLLNFFENSEQFDKLLQFSIVSTIQNNLIKDQLANIYQNRKTTREQLLKK